MELDEVLNFSTLARILDLSNDGILIVDAQREDYPIIYGNHRFSEMTGYAQDEIMGKNCRFLQNEDRDQPELSTVRDAIAQGHSCKVILRNYKKDGEMFYNQLSLSPIVDEKNVITHFLGIQNDVTEEKLVEKEMEKIIFRINQILK